MDPPERPRRRDQAKEFFKHPGKFLKDRFGSPTPSPSRSCPRPASNGYEGVKTTLRNIVDVSDVLPPLRSTAAELLAICDTIEVSFLSKRDTILLTNLSVGIWSEQGRIQRTSQEGRGSITNYGFLSAQCFTGGEGSF